MENYPPHKKPRLALANSSTIDAGEQTVVSGAYISPNIPMGNNYQVFLSFRGIDTHTGFADHLYHGLTNAGVFVFRDNNELCIGEETAPELLCAISQSRISIPILSERYASSKWCLLELARVIELQKSCGHMVLPIFYKVEPSHVQYQTGSFGEAFCSIKNRFKPKVVQQWEHALQAVASLSGWESEKTANGYEGELVNIVVRTVLQKLKQDFQLDILEHLVEIDENVEDIMRRVDLNGCGTKMIGIHGMPGVGKTTLAKFFFNKLSSEHVDHSFIADVGGRARQHGNQYLQNQLISDLLPHACLVSRVDDGINIIKSRFRRKRVLLLLDDVDNIGQLDALVRERNWFGSGSIIIVTTRDVGILDQASFGIDLKYELKPMDAGKSLILFSKLAFRRDSPPSPFEVLSRDIVATTGGLPLALEAIGSQLYGEKDLGIWQEMSKKFRNVPHKKVQEKFRTSYEALDAEATEIFLDIVSFFVGSPTTYPIYLWEDNNLTPRFQIKNLTCHSMIEVGSKNKFIVHGQLRNFGLSIIRREDCNNPTNRSRICEHEEAWTVLDGPQGSKNIQGIRLYESVSPSQKVRVCKSEQLEKFPNLKLLKLKNVNLVGDFQNVLPELRLLEWQMDEDSLPIMNNFHLPSLTILKLSSKFISEDWMRWSSMKMARLKVLDLSYCTALRTTPNLSACKSLEILKLQHCPNLERIDTSIIEVRGTLLVLDLSYCTALQIALNLFACRSQIDTSIIEAPGILLELDLTKGFLELDLTGTLLEVPRGTFGVGLDSSWESPLPVLELDLTAVGSPYSRCCLDSWELSWT